MAPLVSFIIPAYKRPELLRATVASVLAQTYRPLELVIVDDGSPDDTLEVMQSLLPEVEAAGVSPSFHSKPNGGVASTRNLAFAQAKGEYFALLDGDDMSFPQRIEKQLAALKAANADACCCLVERRDGDRVRPYPATAAGLLTGRNPAGVMSLKVWAHTNSLFLHRDLVARAGGYDERLPIFEDDEFLIRLAHHGNFAAVPEALATWIGQPGSLSSVPDKAALERRDAARRLQLEVTRDRCRTLPGWDEADWRVSVARWYKQIINHEIWAAELGLAAADLKHAVELAGWQPLLKRTRRKLLRARLLALFGLRIKNPKDDPIYDT